MGLRVLLDATAVPRDRGGVGRYVDEIVPAVAAAGVEVVAAVRPGQEPALDHPGVDVVTVPSVTGRRPARLVWEQVGLPMLARSVAAHVVHSPHYTLPLMTGCPQVVTLHDATFFSNPEWHLPVKARFFRMATTTAVRRADAVVVPSAATRDAVLAAVGGRAEDFFVAHHGVDRVVFHPAGPQEIDRVAGVLGTTGRRTIVFLGTLEPRKNVVALVEGWVRACATVSAPPLLVLAGARGWDRDIAAALERVPRGLTVLVPGYVPFGDLAGLLSGATVVAYPSLGEGFGLPVLEAMACAAPVLTTRRLSLPEVGGEAVAYTEVDAGSIAASLRRLLDDEQLRRTLSAAGLARAREFTWEAAASVHVRAYEHAVRRSG